MGGTRYPRSKVSLGHGRGWLTKESAASIQRIDRQIGHPLQITEAGRDWAQQNEHYQRYLRYGSPIALNPNTPSVHQKGDAVDSDEAQRILAIMTDHGWIRTVYRWVGGKWTLVERWHFEHFIERDNHRYDANPAQTIEEEEMTMRVIYNTQDKNEETRRAIVGELTFHVVGAVASAAERKLWGPPENVTASDWKTALNMVNTRRAMNGLAPLRGVRGEFPTGGK